MRAVLHTDTDRGRMRLGRGYRDLGMGRWDEVVQLAMHEAAGDEVPWHGNVLNHELRSRKSFVLSQELCPEIRLDWRTVLLSDCFSSMSLYDTMAALVQ